MDQNNLIWHDDIFVLFILVFLADEFACPQTINKWECLFLPPTTCPWPDVITNCHSRDCLPIDGRSFLSSASPKGVTVNESQIAAIMSKFKGPENYKQMPVGVSMYSNDINNVITSMTTAMGTKDTGDIHGLFALYGVMTRFNSVFRGLVIFRTF